MTIEELGKLKECRTMIYHKSITPSASELGAQDYRSLCKIEDQLIPVVDYRKYQEICDLAMIQLKNKPHTDNPGQISDGYHTFDELYEHRTALFAVICRLYPAKSWISFQHSDGSMFPDMFIAGINTPIGSYTYHCEMKYLSYFTGVALLDKAPKWDGHLPADFYRLFTLFN